MSASRYVTLSLAAALLAACTDPGRFDVSETEAALAGPAPLLPTPPIAVLSPAAAMPSPAVAGFNGSYWPLTSSITSLRMPFQLAAGTTITGWQLYVRRAVPGIGTTVQAQCMTPDFVQTNLGPVVRVLDSSTGLISFGQVFSQPITIAADCAYSLLIGASGISGDDVGEGVVYGTRTGTLVLSPLAAVIRDGWHVDFSNADGGSRGYVESVSLTNRFALPIPLHQGERITTVTLALYGNSSADLTMHTAGGQMASIVPDPLGSAFLPNLPPAWTDYVIDLIDTSVADGSFWLEFEADQPGMRVGTVRLSYTN